LYDLRLLLHIRFANLTLASWYHSHVGFSLLTAHGALILHQADNSPVDSNCPIPYDEERIFMVEDFYYLDEEALVAEAQKGQFVGAANVSHSPTSHPRPVSDWSDPLD
jgi:hypothetical protein